MTQSCDLPILRVGQTPDHELDCAKEAAARKIYEEFAPATVRIHHDFVLGSGFFIGDGSRVVTNAHVVNGSSGLLDVETFDHKHLAGRIEKLDDINDLAVIKLEPYEPKSRAVLKIGTSDGAKPGDVLYALGHPQGKFDTYISPGIFTQKGAFNKVFASKDPKDEDWQTFLKTAASKDPALAADGRAVTNSPRVEALLQIEGGNSGGPMVNPGGEVVAVSQFGSLSKQYHKYAWAVPAEQITELLGSPSKFNFNYEKMAEIQAHPGSTLLGNGIAIAMTAKLPRVGGAFLGLISALDMVDLANGERTQPRETSNRIYNKLEWTSDVSMVAGAVMSWVPRLRPVAYAAYGVGLATGFGQSLVPHNTYLTEITRQADPKDKRKPLFWDGVD